MGLSKSGKKELAKSVAWVLLGAIGLTTGLASAITLTSNPVHVEAVLTPAQQEQFRQNQNKDTVLFERTRGN